MLEISGFMWFIEWQNVTGHNFEPTLQSCIFGIFDKSVQYINEINIIILLVKSYIMKCKYEKYYAISRGLWVGCLATKFPC